MNPDSLNAITVGHFRNTLIVSEIVVTLVVFVGFYFIFTRFSKKNKSFKQKNKA